MNVMNILTSKLKPGLILSTPVRGRKFTVESVSPSGIILILGKNSRTYIPAKCWNGIPDFLNGRDWVIIGAIHDYGSSPGTLEDYVNNAKPQKRSTGNYVASVLRYADIVEIDPRPPSKVRLL